MCKIRQSRPLLYQKFHIRKGEKDSREKHTIGQEHLKAPKNIQRTLISVSLQIGVQQRCEHEGPTNYKVEQSFRHLK